MSWKRPGKRLLLHSWRGSNRFLGYIADKLYANPGPIAGADPVFVIGLPRSGTTLLYEALCGNVPFGYLSNLHNLLWGAPELVERLMGLRLRRNWTPVFRSKYGYVWGLGAPSEAANFWYRYFPRRPQAIHPAEATHHRIGNFAAAVRRLSAIHGVPFVFKNTVNSVRLSAIAEALPEARFIRLHRDWKEVFLSIMQGRMRANGNLEAWWSVESPCVNRLQSMRPEEQVARQIFDIENLMDLEQENIGKQRFQRVSYERFCREPVGELTRLTSSLEEKGFGPGWRSNEGDRPIVSIRPPGKRQEFLLRLLRTICETGRAQEMQEESRMEVTSWYNRPLG